MPQSPGARGKARTPGRVPTAPIISIIINIPGRYRSILHPMRYLTRRGVPLIVNPSSSSSSRSTTQIGTIIMPRVTPYPMLYAWSAIA